MNCGDSRFAQQPENGLSLNFPLMRFPHLKGSPIVFSSDLNNAGR
jgi:hypothetical protein